MQQSNPEVVPLASIDAETVAKALVRIFSCVGIPNEVLSVMGTQYISAVMREVSWLLAISEKSLPSYLQWSRGTF